MGKHLSNFCLCNICSYHKVSHDWRNTFFLLGSVPKPNCKGMCKQGWENLWKPSLRTIYQRFGRLVITRFIVIRCELFLKIYFCPDNPKIKLRKVLLLKMNSSGLKVFPEIVSHSLEFRYIFLEVKKEGGTILASWELFALHHQRPKYSWNDTDNAQFLERLKNKALKLVEEKGNHWEYQAESTTMNY